VNEQAATYRTVNVIGLCSMCGGEVTVYLGAWMGLIPPRPSCSSCGAVPAAPKLPVIPMEPPR
jgi:hypothetical protein